jgi:hypothetical protein
VNPGNGRDSARPDRYPSAFLWAVAEFAKQVVDQCDQLFQEQTRAVHDQQTPGTDVGFDTPDPVQPTDIFFQLLLGGPGSVQADNRQTRTPWHTGMDRDNEPGMFRRLRR